MNFNGYEALYQHRWWPTQCPTCDGAIADTDPIAFHAKRETWTSMFGPRDIWIRRVQAHADCTRPFERRARGTCEACGRTFYQSEQFMRGYIGCSGRCRATLAARAKRAKRRAATIDASCPQCNEMFRRTRSDQTYCSTRCRVAHHRSAS